MSKLRIDYFIDHLKVGGAQRHLLELFASLDRRRFALQVTVAKAEGPLIAAVERLGIPVRSFGVGASIGRPGTLAEMFAKPAAGFDVYAPENVSPLVTFLASPAGERVSGSVLIVYGKQITLVSAPKLEPVFETAVPWTYDGVVEKLGPWFDAHSPVLDGFTVPAT